jgi:hypothetical protein
MPASSREKRVVYGAGVVQGSLGLLSFRVTRPHPRKLRINDAVSSR